MEVLIKDTDAKSIAGELAIQFRERSWYYDKEGTFVNDNYDDLKANEFFKLTIPTELGGHGLPYAEMCEIIRTIGTGCGSTALAFSMHNHLLAAAIWKYKKGQGGEAMLEKVAREQPVLISTGAKDWLDSNGESEKVAGGYEICGLKHFASQSAIGNVAVTSFRHYDQDSDSWKVMHCSVPMNAEGVSHLGNWDSMGMRGTGSHTIKFNKVFVPDSAVALVRDAGEFHPVWNVVLTVAMPLIMSAYLGIAERASRLVLDKYKGFEGDISADHGRIGQMINHLTTARVMWKDMIRLCNEFDFAPENTLGNEVLMRKTVVAREVIATVTAALELNGGQSYFKNQEMERLFRDVQGARFHPLAESEQIVFSGKHWLGK